MKRILPWILIVSIVIALSVTAYAKTDTGLEIKISDAAVTLYDDDQTVTIKFNTPKCYNLEGTWSTTASGKTNSIKLTGLTATFSGADKLDTTTGEVIWIDYTFSAPVQGQIMTATYTIPAGTPAGEYTVTFTRDVFTGEDYNPDNTDVVYTATITVTHHTCSDAVNDGDHICDDPNCDKSVTECSHGSFGKDDTNHWSICGECNQTIAGTTVPHDFTNGDCVCGAEKPGMKGDLSGDDEVSAEDLTLLARHIAGIEDLPDDTLQFADLDGIDGISAGDLTTLARYIAGIITQWP